MPPFSAFPLEPRTGAGLTREPGFTRSCAETERVSDFSEVACPPSAAYRFRKFAQAELEFRDAIRLGPGFYKDHYNLGFALHHQGKFAEAEREFREAARLGPDFYFGPHWAALAMGEQRKYAAAVQYYVERSAADPKFADSFNRRTHTWNDMGAAVLLAVAGEQEPWREYCRIVAGRQFDKQPPDESANAMVIRTCLLFDPATSDPVEWIRLAGKALQVKPSSYEAQAGLALAQYRASRYGEAMKTGDLQGPP